MDWNDLLDIIFTEEEDLRRMGRQGGPEAAAAAEEAVAATRKAREDAERVIGRIFERAGVAKKADVEELGKRVDELTRKVEELMKRLG